METDKMTNNEEYEKALNDSIKAYRNAVKDSNARVPQGYGLAFNYGYTFGMQQAHAEQKEIAERQLNFHREQIATAAMQGLLASGSPTTNSPGFIAQRAVACADALLNELNKTEDEGEA